MLKNLKKMINHIKPNFTDIKTSVNNTNMISLVVFSLVNSLGFDCYDLY